MTDSVVSLCDGHGCRFRMPVFLRKRQLRQQQRWQQSVAVAVGAGAGAGAGVAAGAVSAVAIQVITLPSLYLDALPAPLRRFPSATVVRVGVSL